MKISYKYGNGIIEIVGGSIIDYKADAIVVPANPNLEYFVERVQCTVSGVGGPEIFKEASKVADKYVKENGIVKIHDLEAKVPLFSAHLTTGGKLPVKYVIHSVCFDYNPEKELYSNKDAIAKSTRNVLELGKQHNLKSIGFPLLRTGLHISLVKSIDAMITEFENHLNEKTSIERLGLILFGSNAYSVARSYAEKRHNNICLW